jgi:hypothetical protein
MNLNELKFKHPFNMIISGMTQSGKTIFVSRLIKNWKNLLKINKNQLKILFCFKENHPNLFAKNVEFIYYKNLPNLSDLKKFSPDIVVLDDLMTDVNLEVCELFTVHSHALEISVIFIVQNLFNKNKYMRTISLNSHYFVIMKGIRNENQVEILARQTFGKKSKDVVDAFKFATQEPYGYLVFDFHPNTNRELILRTRIFEEEIPPSLARKHSIAPIYFDIS